jgi:hypothetical protein
MDIGEIVRRVDVEPPESIPMPTEPAREPATAPDPVEPAVPATPS